MITSANAFLDLKERIAKSTLMNVRQSLARTDPRALTELTITLADAYLDGLERTAKKTSMSALETLA
jgi:hypothetical protein